MIRNALAARLERLANGFDGEFQQAGPCRLWKGYI